MKVLIGYSTCPLTQQAFERRGHEAWTCDLLPSRGRSDRHLLCDIWEVAEDPSWDMGIFHPMCTYLTVSAAWAFNDPDFAKYPGVGYHQKVKPDTKTGSERREARESAVQNFNKLLKLPYPKVVENPSPSFLHNAVRKPDQIIQPYEFGDDASKGTGLWLDRLEPLTINPELRCGGRWVEHKGKLVERWSNQTDSGQNRLSPSEDRWLERSATYPGIAEAFGRQWGGEITTIGDLL